MTMKDELQKEIDDLKKELSDAMDAIRSLAMQQTNNVQLLARHQDTIADIKTELNRVKNLAMDQGTKHDTSVTKYV